MRFLVDEHLSHLAALLGQDSHEVLTVRELGLLGEPDPVILMAAVDSAAVLITENHDGFLIMSFTAGVVAVSGNITPARLAADGRAFEACAAPARASPKPPAAVTSARRGAHSCQARPALRRFPFPATGSGGG